MSDIVERLRDDQPGERQCVREARMDLGCLLMEAADEIEKLRAALRKLYDHEGERVLNSIGIECYTEELEDALCEARAALGEKE
jgi:hypothetical protein